MAIKKFPCGTYGRQTLQFFPAPFKAPLRAFASLVFPWKDNEVLLCNIGDRGWCIPSGRVEPYESSIEAAKREAIEEAGAQIGCIQYIGCYSIRERGEQRWADVFVAKVEKLGEIEMPQESLGRKFVTLDQLPTVYHQWNELTKLVFDYSYEVACRSQQL